MENTQENWNGFMNRYGRECTEIAVEASTSGKYVARLLRDNGFKIHLANPNELKMIFRSNKKTDKNDAMIHAKLLRTGDLPESYLPSKEIDGLRIYIIYRRPLEEELPIRFIQYLQCMVRTFLYAPAGI